MHGLKLTDGFESLPEQFYSHVVPTPFEHPHLVHYNSEAARLIGLAENAPQHPQFLDWFTGTIPLGNSPILSSVYAGHQFGQFVPQLGDGRAHLIGTAHTSAGDRCELQLKGSGKTPYSRFGDGRAVLRSSIREYLCSEAMHHLGIPTTRALCIIGSDEPVMRETIERGAMITRLAPTHIRFGHFEFFQHTQQDPLAVKQLADYVIAHHYPDLSYDAWFAEIVRRTAVMIAQWQAVGFAHGVMNTDNMSILGITLDYGPFGFLDAYNPHFICNHSDHTGRYVFNAQPMIALWNLYALGYALRTLLNQDDTDTALASYQETLLTHYTLLMRQKLGLVRAEEEDKALIQDLLALLHEAEMDYTCFFRSLSDASVSFPRAWESWQQRYQQRLARESSTPEERRSAMRRVNPKYILRNHLAQGAIEKAEAGDYTEVARLFAILQTPFDDQPEHDSYAVPAPDWAKDLCISCSS